jgi:hypothetical protein
LASLDGPGLGETQGLVDVPHAVGTEESAAVGDERFRRAEPLDHSVVHREEAARSCVRETALASTACLWFSRIA